MDRIYRFRNFFGLLSAATYTLSLYVSYSVSLTLPSMIRSSLMVTGQLLLISLIYPPIFLGDLWIWTGLLGVLGIVITTLSYYKGIPHLSVGTVGRGCGIPHRSRLYFINLT